MTAITFTGLDDDDARLLLARPTSAETMCYMPIVGTATAMLSLMNLSC